jgi:hypothetical protein
LVTVNLETGHSLFLNIAAPPNGKEPVKVITTVSVDGKVATLTGTSVAIQFRYCGSDSAKRTFAASQNKVREYKGDSRAFETCPVTFIPPPENAKQSLIVLAETRKGRDSTFLLVSSDNPEHKSVGVLVRMVRRPWTVSFSSGLGGFYPRDERYRLEPTATVGESKIVQASRGEIPYSLATFAHYDRIGLPFSLSLGVSTKVPADDVAVLLGLSYKLRTLPIGKSGYLTFGAALARFSGLSPELEGKFDAGSAVPSATTVASLTEKRRKVTFFFAVTFGFAGGSEDDFGKRVAGR